jgi:uncharacterized membrane protein YgcG
MPGQGRAVLTNQCTEVAFDHRAVGRDTGDDATVGVQHVHMTAVDAEKSTLTGKFTLMLHELCQGTPHSRLPHLLLLPSQMCTPLSCSSLAFVLPRMNHSSSSSTPGSSSSRGSGGGSSSGSSSSSDGGRAMC